MPLSSYPPSPAFPPAPLAMPPSSWPLNTGIVHSLHWDLGGFIQYLCLSSRQADKQIQTWVTSLYLSSINRPAKSVPPASFYVCLNQTYSFFFFPIASLSRLVFLNRGHVVLSWDLWRFQKGLRWNFYKWGGWAWHETRDYLIGQKETNMRKWLRNFFRTLFPKVTYTAWDHVGEIVALVVIGRCFWSFSGGTEWFYFCKGRVDK